MKAKVSGTKKKINGTTFLLMITILLFVVMYAAGMIVFNDKGFAKPQMFLNLFISNAGLLVIAMGETIVMITAGIDISVGSVTALVCMVAANQMENHGASAYTALLMALVIGLLFGLVQGFLVSYLEIQPFILSKMQLSWHGLNTKFTCRLVLTVRGENSSRHIFIRQLSLQSSF